MAEYVPMLIQFLLLVFICIITVAQDVKIKKENELLKEENKKLSSDLIKIMQENIKMKNQANADAE